MEYIEGLFIIQGLFIIEGLLMGGLIEPGPSFMKLQGSQNFFNSKVILQMPCLVYFASKHPDFGCFVFVRIDYNIVATIAITYIIVVDIAIAKGIATTRGTATAGGTATVTVMGIATTKLRHQLRCGE